MKKVLKVIGIIFLIIVLLMVGLIIKNYITSISPYISKNYYEEFKSESILEKKYAGIGNYESSYVEYKSDNKSVKKIRVWYPKELENSDKKYPMIMAVNASNTAVLNYEPFFERLSTWGFIVVGTEDRQAGSAQTTSETLDYMLDISNDSILYNKIDKENIGIVGYSQGGAGALRAVTEFENGSNYKTIFTGSAAYPLLAKNMGWEYDYTKINIPYFMTASTGNSDDTGVTDIENEYGGVSPLKSLIEIYNGMSNEVLKVRARVNNAEHEDMQVKTDGYMTAWMLYQLQNNEEAKTVFIGENAEILSNSNWQDIEKSK